MAPRLLRVSYRFAVRITDNSEESRQGVSILRFDRYHLWRRAVAEPTLVETEYRLWHVSGEWRWTAVRAVPVLNADGSAREWVGMNLDITERKRSEEALREAAERFRFMAESMPQKIFTAKPNGDVDYFNQQWTEFTGLTFEQIRDWGWLQFIHPDDVEENIRRWQHSIDTGEYFQLEHRFRRKDGEYRWHLSRAHALRNADGQVLMWIGSNTDIEDQKQTERALKEANRRKDEFLGMLAHELRTPLSAISNVAEILGQQRTSDRETTRLRAMLTRQIRTLTRMVEDLLDISRITSGKIRLEKEVIALGPVISRAVESTRTLMESRRHELIVSEPDAPLRIVAQHNVKGQVRSLL